MVVAAALTATLASCAAPESGPALGVLQADFQWEAQDWQAGIRVAVLNLSWARWQPRRQDTDQSYVDSARQVADGYRRAGWAVEVDPGLQEPPQWVLDLPDGQLVDQAGTRSGTANFEFSATVRSRAARYLEAVVATLGPVTAYRVGLSPNGEMLYPDVSGGQWWAFDPEAQGKERGLPASQRPAPLPGWVPGEPEWRGHPVTRPQVDAWYSWYLGALVAAEAWEISVYRAAGFGGTLQLVMPGYGATPSNYQSELDELLTPSGYDDHTVNAGAVWWKVLDLLPDLDHTEVDISSTGDSSGIPGRRDCEGADAGMPVAAADPTRSGWSDTRWLTYLARRHRLPVVGENPGNTPAGRFAAIMDLARGCHFKALLWAWDYQLHDPARHGYVTLSEVAGYLSGHRAQERQG